MTFRFSLRNKKSATPNWQGLDSSGLKLIVLNIRVFLYAIILPKEAINLHNLSVKTESLVGLSHDSKEMRLLQVYLDFSKCTFALKLLRPNSGLELNGQDLVYALSLCAGSLYEALSGFAHIKGPARKSITSEDGMAFESLKYLCNKESNLFKEVPLFKIRNKLAFHTDATHITAYINAVNEGKKETVNLLTLQDADSILYPLANDLISSWIVEVFNGVEGVEDAGARLGKTASHLSNVVYILSAKWLGAEVTMF